MINVINNQLELVLEDLELITDPYQRCMVRTSLMTALAQCITEEPYELEGKEAIKHNKPKDVILKEPKAEIEEEPIEFTEEAQKDNEVEAEKTEVEAAPKEIDIEPEIQEPIVVEYTDEEGNVHDLNITDAWNTISTNLKEDVTEDEAVSIAQNITLYNLLPIYTTFEELKDCENKMMLAYYLQGVGLEDINNVIISDITDGQCNDVYELVNDDNLDFIVTSIADRLEDSEEE